MCVRLAHQGDGVLAVNAAEAVAANLHAGDGDLLRQPQHHVGEAFPQRERDRSATFH